MTLVALGVDVGGSSIKYAPVQVQMGKLLTEVRSVPTPQPFHGDALAQVVAGLTSGLSDDSAVGVALPCVVRGGVIHTAANLDASLIGLDVEALLKTRMRRPVVVLNDADAAGLAEMRWGAARGVRGTVMVLTFGTGIGSALFVDGRLVPNTELGHMEVDGVEGELRASARVRTEEALDWAQWTSRVNRYLEAINRLFWPELIVMGGGISESFEQFAPLLRSRAPVKAAILGPGAGVVGAAMAAAVREA
jgi:polyphosphate glucokinase